MTAGCLDALAVDTLPSCCSFWGLNKIAAPGEEIVTTLDAVFADLRAIMAPYAAELNAKKNDTVELYVDTWHVQKNQKPVFFGAVQIKKSYVSYHLMPVYVKPELLATVSPELRACMQGKSCFNFKASDPRLFEELTALTQAGYASYQEQGFV